MFSSLRKTMKVKLIAQVTVIHEHISRISDFCIGYMRIQKKKMPIT